MTERDETEELATTEEIDNRENRQPRRRKVRGRRERDKARGKATGAEAYQRALLQVSRNTPDREEAPIGAERRNHTRSAEGERKRCDCWLIARSREVEREVRCIADSVHPSGEGNRSEKNSTRR